MRLRDLIPGKSILEGDRVSLKSILDKEIEFVNWVAFNNNHGPGVMLQFFEDGKPYVFMTHSQCLKKDIEAWEAIKGKEPFSAKVVKKKTLNGNCALIFT